MKEILFGERGVRYIAIGIVAFLTFGGIVYFISQNKPVRQEPDNTITRTSAESVVDRRETASLPQAPRTLESIRAELEMALKSGGMHPSDSALIERAIGELAAQGVDVSELRRLFEKIPIGGSPQPDPPPQISPPAQKTTRIDPRPFWEYDPSKPELGWYWVRDGKPPACPEPLVIGSPVDVNLATGILYPGQVRGDGPEDFKPHGGFALKPNSKIELKAPMDGYLTSVAKFTDEFGYHVGLTFQNPCGIQFGGGHWGALPSDLQAIVDKVPLKSYGDSRNEPISPPYFVKKGQIIVTGLQEKANPERPGFDWGVTDLRQPNTASKDLRFRELYGYAPWNTYYGVCWLDLLPPDQKAVLKNLPGVDGKQGKNSEYCK